MKKKRKRCYGKRIISMMLVAVMLSSVMPDIPAVNMPMEKVEAATTITTMDLVSYCNSIVGSSYPASRCLAFVASVFARFGVSNSACCAHNYGSQVICSTSSTNIPVGADVFFTGSKIRCSCGNMCGHVAIYIGDGNVIHAYNGKVVKEPLSRVMGWGGYNYRGWGFHKNVNIVDNGIPSGGGGGGGATVPTRVLSTGSRGSDVVWLQSMLNKTISAGLAEDGIFGNGTNAAVRRFQSIYGLTVDGKVGYYTRTKLEEVWVGMQVVNPTGISISAASMNLTTGKSGQLSASVQPSNASNKTVQWSSSDSSVASVSNGVITGKKEGSATIKATTSNGKTAACTVNVYDTRTVTFVNEDGTVLSEQSVEYGKSATAPVAPEKTGHTFAGWNGTYQNVKTNATVTATYTKNVYKVTFKETDGTKIGETQSVPYNESAKAPDESKLNIPDGYTFKGWSESFENITSDLVIYPVYEWADEELPVVISAADDACKANYEEGIYYLTFTLKNHSTEPRNARVMSYMVTDSGMLVAQGETRTVVIPEAEEKEDGTWNDGTKTVTDMYIVCKSPADKARVVVLDDYESAVPLAEMLDIPVEAAGYGDWTDKAPETAQSDCQKRTMYRSKNVKYTESKSSSLAGWTKYDSKVTGYEVMDDKNYYGNGRSASAPADTTTRQYWAEAIPTSYNPGIYTVPTYNISISTTGGDTYRSMVRWIQCSMCRLGYYTAIDGIYGNNTAAVVKSFQRANGLSADGIVGANTRSVIQSKLNALPLYNYYYHTKTAVTTYYFYQPESSWSEWKDVAIAGDTTINAGKTKVLVETKEQYRYKEYATVATGETMHPECKLPDEAKSLAGKDAMVIVFKNKVNQIAEDNVEYLGTTKIGSDGSLDISFIPREKQSYEGTGDYTVVLGVKGTTNYVKVGVIEPEKPSYKVTFVDDEGNAISEQTVMEGHDAEVPDAPEKEGYRFVGWNAGVTNIHDDMTIMAQYEKLRCTVTYVDWENREITSNEYEYGSAIEFREEPEAPEGMEFDGWSIEEGTTITDNMVCEASFKKQVFNVTFVDWDGKEVMEQEVPYGEAAMEPEVVKGDDSTTTATDTKEGTIPEKTDNMVFVSWGEDIDLSNITSDLVVGAIYEYEETVAGLTTSVEGGEYEEAQSVELAACPDDATIYYTTDGSDPTDMDNKNVKEYTQAIQITDDTKLKYYACRMGMNDSAVYEVWYAINQKGNVPKHIVSIEAINTFDGTALDGYHDFVKDGSKLNPMEVLVNEYDSVELEGIYYDEAFTQKWQENAETVTDSVTLYAKYEAKKFDVTYLDEDGSTITVGKVAYGSPADDSVALEKEGLRFTRWESVDDPTCVTKDMTVTAKYLSESEYATIKFARNRYSIMEGSIFKLSSKVSYADGSPALEEKIEWKSSDESKATVDIDGNINALEKGEVTIYARVMSSGEKDECTINITGNPETSVCLLSNSSYKIENGYLRNILSGKNTVSEVKAQIDADKLRFIDSDNIELGESECVGTGTRVQLWNNEGALLDEVVVILNGDYNGDGLVNAKDVSGISRMLLGKEEATDAQLRAMDVNGDGHVNNRDAAMLARYLVGKERL